MKLINMSWYLQILECLGEVYNQTDGSPEMVVEIHVPLGCRANLDMIYAILVFLTTITNQVK